MNSAYTVILFYRFKKVKNLPVFTQKQRTLCEDFGLKGRMLIATEGVNATLEGTTKNIKDYIKKLKAQTFFKGLVVKESPGNGNGFTKLQVKTRPEVVTLDAGEFNIAKETAKMITAKKLDTMYEKGEDFTVLDLRNDYEIEAGYFEKTVNPGLRFFRDLPQKIGELGHLKNKKVVTVCTGGIRCEKATCLLKREGFTNLYQLKDGIHTYIQQFPAKRFKGTLFVFDNRMVHPIAASKKRQVVGQCHFCSVPCEEFYNDDRVRPSRKVVCCPNCLPKHAKYLRAATSAINDISLRSQ